MNMPVLWCRNDQHSSRLQHSVALLYRDRWFHEMFQDFYQDGQTSNSIPDWQVMGITNEIHVRPAEPI